MTPVQLSLTDQQPPMVRASDPVTSRAAAKSVSVSRRQGEVLHGLAICGGGTADDVQSVLAAIGFRRDRNCIAKRLGELRDAGAVRVSGFSVGPSGQQVQRFQPVAVDIEWPAR